MTRPTPKHNPSWLVAAALGVALVVGPGRAEASDGGVSTSGGSVSYQLAIPRFIDGTDASAPAHFNSFSPWTINYADCANDVVMQFTLELTSIPAGDTIQVWAGSGSANCTFPAARTAASSSTPGDFPGRCWPAAPIGALDPTAAAPTARVRVRDLVAYIGQDNPPVSYSAAIDDSVCVPHATTTAVPLSIYFIAVPAAGSADGGATTPPGADGVPALYQTTAALVGPFEPQDAAIPPGDMTATTLTVTWLPQGESTIQGYNIYFQDQGIGGTQTGVVADASPGPGIQAYCQTPLPCDGGISDDDGGFDDAGLDDGGYDDASTDGSADGGTTDATVHDAGPTDATLFDAGVADATLSDADAADSNASAGSCDGGRSDAMVQVDAAALLGLSDAALAEMGCIITGTENKNPPPQNNGLCVSGPLSSVFTVDGGTGSLASGTTLEAGTSTLTTVTDGGTDSGDASTTGTTGSTSLNTVVAETAGISNIPWKYLSIYQSGATTASYTVTGLTTGHQYAIGVAAVDSYGNTGPVALGCSTPTAVNDFYSAYTTDGGKAGGGFCSLSAVGSRTGGACVALSLAGLVVLIERRRRRTGRAS